MTDHLPSEDCDDDMQPIMVMLNAARPHNLEAEAVWSFALHLKRGGTIGDAVNHAMREWDL